MKNPEHNICFISLCAPTGSEASNYILEYPPPQTYGVCGFHKQAYLKGYNVFFVYTWSVCVCVHIFTLWFMIL